MADDPRSDDVMERLLERLEQDDRRIVAQLTEIVSLQVLQQAKQTEIDRLLRYIERQKAFIVEYATHTPDCDIRRKPSKSCSCNFELDLLALPKDP